MKRKMLSWVIIAFLVLGIIAIYLESEFEVKNGIRAGAGLLGIASILWGIEEFVDHRVFYSISWEKTEKEMTLRTIGSITVSLLRLLMGIGLVTISLLGFIGLGDLAENYVKNRPGLVMVFLSALGFTYGVQLFLSKKKQGKSLQIFLENVFAGMFGVFLILLSFTVLALGLIEILWPEGFRDMIQLFLSRLLFPFSMQ